MMYEVVVIGAGFSGIGAGIRLKKAQINSFVILEQADDLGGTWRDNTYPGIAVDISSFAYSFSFEQNPHWSRTYAPGREIKAYAHHCARKYGLSRHMAFGVAVTRIVFDEETSCWSIHTRGGRVFRTRFVICATGALTQPKKLGIEGEGDFAGKMMHTARWDHGYDLKDKRVAVIGTGASAVQVVPSIAGKVARMHVFQRTPTWVLPRPDRAIPPWAQTMFRYVPVTQRACRWAASAYTEAIMVLGIMHHKQMPSIVRRIEAASMRHLERQVPDPELQKKLTPHYGFGCKRPTFSNTYWRTFMRDDVELVTETIARITKDAIVTTDDVRRPIDALILATGFKVFEHGNLPTFGVYGVGGLELSAFWREHRFQAYQGATIPKFPNYFTILGPYGTTGASWFSMIEAQTTHALRCIREARRRRATRVEVRQAPHDAHFKNMLRRQQNAVFQNNNCAAANSYYFDHHGDAPFLRPTSSIEMWWDSRHFPLRHYRFSI